MIRTENELRLFRPRRRKPKTENRKPKTRDVAFDAKKKKEKTKRKDAPSVFPDPVPGFLLPSLGFAELCFLQLFRAFRRSDALVPCHAVVDHRVHQNERRLGREPIVPQHAFRDGLRVRLNLRAQRRKRRRVQPSRDRREQFRKRVRHGRGGSQKSETLVCSRPPRFLVRAANRRNLLALLRRATEDVGVQDGDDFFQRVVDVLGVRLVTRPLRLRRCFNRRVEDGVKRRAEHVYHEPAVEARRQQRDDAREVRGAEPRARRRQSGARAVAHALRARPQAVGHLPQHAGDVVLQVTSGEEPQHRHRRGGGGGADRASFAFVILHHGERFEFRKNV